MLDEDQYGNLSVMAVSHGGGVVPVGTPPPCHVAITLACKDSTYLLMYTLRS